MDKEQETKLSLLMRAMIKYDGGDVPRIQHFVKVHDFARMIGVAEDMESEQLFILEAAAILHDVGIHAAEAKYGNSHGKHQEELGPAEAKKVLAEVGGFTEQQTERICWLIAHHHLVNSFEDNLSKEAIASFRENVFRSPSAIDMLNMMWNL